MDVFLLCPSASVRTGVICLALLATVLEYSLLVGDRVALRDLDRKGIN